MVITKYMVGRCNQTIHRYMSVLKFVCPVFFLKNTTYAGRKDVLRSELFNAFSQQQPVKGVQAVKTSENQRDGLGYEVLKKRGRIIKISQKIIVAAITRHHSGLIPKNMKHLTTSCERERNQQKLILISKKGIPCQCRRYFAFAEMILSFLENWDVDVKMSVRSFIYA